MKLTKSRWRMVSERQYFSTSLFEGRLHNVSKLVMSASGLKNIGPDSGAPGDCERKRVMTDIVEGCSYRQSRNRALADVVAASKFGMPSNSGSVIEGVISVDADAGSLSEARAQPSGQGARSQIPGQMPRMRSEGAGRRFGQVGAAERVSPAVLLRRRRARRDPGRRCERAPG